VTDKTLAGPAEKEKTLLFGIEKKTLSILAGIALLAILVIVATVIILFPANPGTVPSPPVLPGPAPVETLPGVPAVTTGPTVRTPGTPLPTQPVDFVLVPSDQVTCGLTCRQLDATITNTGYETAHNVCITLTIHTSRDEIISVNGNPALQQCVGDIAAGASKTEPITVNADCGAFATKCIGETLTLGTTATSDERTVQFPDQQVAV
jgi:hypothetical protein